MDKLSLFIDTENLPKQRKINKSINKIAEQTKTTGEVYICRIIVQLTCFFFFQMSLEQVMVTVNSDVHNNSAASDNNRLGKTILF